MGPTRSSMHSSMDLTQLLMLINLGWARLIMCRIPLHMCSRIIGSNMLLLMLRHIMVSSLTCMMCGVMVRRSLMLLRGNMALGSKWMVLRWASVINPGVPNYSGTLMLGLMCSSSIGSDCTLLMHRFNWCIRANGIDGMVICCS